MPSKSLKQAKLMAAVAHNQALARRLGIPQSVAREFFAADKAIWWNKTKRKRKPRK
jgi:hypothetical protein